MIINKYSDKPRFLIKVGKDQINQDIFWNIQFIYRRQRIFSFDCFNEVFDEDLCNYIHSNAHTTIRKNYSNMPWHKNYNHGKELFNDQIFHLGDWFDDITFYCDIHRNNKITQKNIYIKCDKPSEYIYDITSEIPQPNKEVLKKIQKYTYEQAYIMNPLQIPEYYLIKKQQVKFTSVWCSSYKYSYVGISKPITLAEIREFLINIMIKIHENLL